MKFDNQLRHAIRIIETYGGEIPLAVWLKEFFRANRQMGSRDRKQLSTLVYSFYRLGHSLRQLPVADRLLAGIFICLDRSNEMLDYFHPRWNERIGVPLTEKIAFFQTQSEGAGFSPADIFPWKSELSPEIDYEAFCLSFLRQPDLFLRIRPGCRESVTQSLATVGVPHEFLAPAAIRLPNSYAIETLFTPDREVVIQDYSSQQLAEFLTLPEPPEFFWDTCAASGGKSILIHDLYPQLHITASDIRDSILRNLRTRFAAAGIKRYSTFHADLACQAPPASAANADLILADLPCTGSGTWSRTPEALYFFDPAAILKYADRQRSILRHIAAHLAPDASLVYCTCSVFRRENEEITEWVETKFKLATRMRKTLIGYPRHADTLFAARFLR
jgi:16S rRNA (cytosine967-C5)-methyltransferase